MAVTKMCISRGLGGRIDLTEINCPGPDDATKKMLRLFGELSNAYIVCPAEKTGDTMRLCKMNLAVHALEGDVREGNTYYEDLHSRIE